MNAIITIPVRDTINRVLRNSLETCGIPWLPIYEMSDLPRARSYLVTMALRSEAERILFIDADIVVSAEEIHRLASHPRVNASNAVTGLYAVRDGSRWACSSKDDATFPDGCRRAERAGLGFACVSRLSLAASAALVPGLLDEKFGLWYPVCVPLIHESGGKAEYIPEDHALWWRLSQVGVQLWADTTLVAGHLASITLRGCLPQET